LTWLADWSEQSADNTQTKVAINFNLIFFLSSSSTLTNQLDRSVHMRTNFLTFFFLLYKSFLPNFPIQMSASYNQNQFGETNWAK